MLLHNLVKQCAFSHDGSYRKNSYNRLSDLIAAMHSAMPKVIYKQPYIKFTPKAGYIN